MATKQHYDNAKRIMTAGIGAKAASELFSSIAEDCIQFGVSILIDTPYSDENNSKLCDLLDGLFKVIEDYKIAHDAEFLELMSELESASGENPVPEVSDSHLAPFNFSNNKRTN